MNPAVRVCGACTGDGSHRIGGEGFSAAAVYLAALASVELHGLSLELEYLCADHRAELERMIHDHMLARRGLRGRL